MNATLVPFRSVRGFVGAARDGLAEVADPEAAEPMRAYMKSETPFRGAPKPARERLPRTVPAVAPGGAQASRRVIPSNAPRPGLTSADRRTSDTIGATNIDPNSGCSPKATRVGPPASYRQHMAKGSNRLVLATVVVAALFAAGNTDSDEGDPSAATATATGTGAPRTSFPTASVLGQRAKDQEPAPEGPAVELVADPTEDECVLTASEVQALVGAPVERTTMTSIPGVDERPNRGCVAVEGENQLVLMNVYRVRSGTPADAVRGPADGRRPLDGVGEAAAIVAGRVGPSLQAAGQRHLVTLAVAYVDPSDDAWRAAGRAALARLE